MSPGVLEIRVAQGPADWAIMEKGGDYLIGTKDNTPKRQEAAVNTLRGTPFLQ